MIPFAGRLAGAAVNDPAVRHVPPVAYQGFFKSVPVKSSV
jgi:hypothetical protein